MRIWGQPTCSARFLEQNSLCNLPCHRQLLTSHPDTSGVWAHFTHLCCNVCMSRIRDKWLGITQSCFAIRVLIVADWWWWQLWNMALSCQLRLFLLQDYCVLGCETVQFDRYKRLERSCFLWSWKQNVSPNFDIHRLEWSTSPHNFPNLFFRCRGRNISKEEVFIYFRFLEKHRFVNMSLHFLLCTFLGAFAKLLKATTRVVNSVCLSIRPSAWSNSVPTGRTFMKFVISLFFLTLLRKVQFY
jgi:hypothetical protein